MFVCTAKIADRRYRKPDQGHSVHLREALEALIKNYKNGLARFKALPFLENEDMLMGCVGELMEVC